MSNITLEQVLLVAELHPDISVQEIAKKRMREMATTLFTQAIENDVKKREMSPAYSDYSFLWLSTNPRIPSEIRDQAGNYIISIYVRNGNFFELKSIAENVAFSENVRHLAAREIVYAYINSVNILEQSTVTSDREK